MLSHPSYKVCRRLGSGIFDKCQTQKFALSEAKHSKFARKTRRNLSDFAKQLLEKQRVRFAYGVSERQLRKYVEASFRGAAQGADPASRMVQQLEMRLDNVVYRAGLVASRRAARQLVSHGHVLVNNVRTTIPSRQIVAGDTFSVRTRTKNLPIATHIKERLENASVPMWMKFDASSFEGTVSTQPKLEQVELPGSVSAILEFYSR